ncbi:MAG TPA: CapA family protein [Candidatus Tectomicrobia bacterium]|nr:CapA family protein [Candidatus Tectomicrobia bacterium]
MATITVFLAGDVMTGRGIDQILPHPGRPELHEAHVNDARVYVRLAEEASGPVPRPVEPAYIWGDALGELARVAPDARIVNLETAITRSEDRWPGKAVHYRMHPGNVGCLTAADIDVCALANNHVLDHGYAGLRETLRTLASAGVKTAGAGLTRADAETPAIVDLPRHRRVVVFSLGSPTSGVPAAWAATDERPGVDFLPDLSDRTAERVIARVRRVKRPGDVVIASIHWGTNWGFEVPRAHVRFAHRLAAGGVDVVHGHSSHHPRAIERYRDALILYGCGDFIDDYEGIGGYEAFRDDLVLMYFAEVDVRGPRRPRLRMTPLRIRRMRLNHASDDEARWLRDTIMEASREFGSRVDLAPDGRLVLAPASGPSA